MNSSLGRCAHPSTNTLTLIWSLVQAPNKDVFGQELQTKNSTDQANCPKCGKTVATMKFMHHLENCLGLGLGRQSSRVASRRYTETCQMLMHWLSPAFCSSRIQDAANGSQIGRAVSSSPFDSESDKEGSVSEKKSMYSCWAIPFDSCHLTHSVEK